MSSYALNTRHKILQTTWKLLENGDAAKTRMADIAKAVGISRQALYLHFPNRADLLIATARYLDEIKKVDERLAASRAAQTGTDRLNAYIEAWGNYIPEIFGMARAFQALMPTDDAAREAWEDRMDAMKHGCAAAVRQIKADGNLQPSLTEVEATDLLFVLLSVQNWEILCRDNAWDQERYITVMQGTARRALLATETRAAQ